MLWREAREVANKQMCSWRIISKPLAWARSVGWDFTGRDQKGLVLRSQGSAHAACTGANQAEKKGLPWEDTKSAGGFFVKPLCFILYYLDARSCVSRNLIKAVFSDRGKTFSFECS